MVKKAQKNSFPEKRVSSIGFIQNDELKILLVKPSYYKYWHLPGGFVDENESPLVAVSREIKEEVNLDLEPDRLMIINYHSGSEQQKEVLVFIFDYGIIQHENFKALTVDHAEIVDYGFFTKQEALNLVGPDKKDQLRMCYRAHETSEFFYLNDNKPFLNKKPDNN